MRQLKKKQTRPLFQGIVLVMALLIWWLLQREPSQESLIQDGIGAQLNYCIDGDTAGLYVNGEKEKVRFIAVDTPELSSEDYYATEARDYTCNTLKNAQSIVLVKDPNSDERDKFGRMIAWVYVDDSLLQEELVEKGYAKVRYIYGDYMHVDMLNQKQKEAKSNRLGIWK